MLPTPADQAHQAVEVVIDGRVRAWAGNAAALLVAVIMAQVGVATNSPPGVHTGKDPGQRSPTAATTVAAATGHARTIRPATSPIKHVVIIYQENHSFDDLLGRLCETRTPRCNGYTGRVRFADGTVARNVRERDIVPVVSHSHRAQRRALHDRWDDMGGCAKYPYRCVSHVVPSQIPNLARMVEKFAVADRTFEALPTASWGSHFQLASGSPLGFWNGDNPTRSVTGATERAGWGCTSDRDEWWRGKEWVPACVPDRQGRGPYRSSPVSYHATLMQRLESKHLTWHVYQGMARHRRPPHGIWQFCTYFYWCYRNRLDFQHISPLHGFRLAAAGKEPMPSVSFVLPIGRVSQHNSTSLELGDDYIGRLAHAVMAGPRWRSTAIFITYDDCGCFYDHVRPPPGHGFRLPMVIVSPWVKRAYTDATTTTAPYGMQAFIVHDFGLAPLSRQVSTSYDYHRSFDFGQRPLRGVRTTTQSISKTEQARLRELAPTLKDDVS